MTYKKPITFLRGSIKWLTGTATLRDIWEIKQQVNQLDTGTEQTTGHSSPCHFYPKCHKICSSSIDRN